MKDEYAVGNRGRLSTTAASLRILRAMQGSRCEKCEARPATRYIPHAKPSFRCEPCAERLRQVKEFFHKTKEQR